MKHEAVNRSAELQRIADDSPSNQARGRAFEKWIIDLLSDAELAPRAAYRPEGEEIDGSFIFTQRVFLLEAKWHKNPLPASSLYQFKGKLDGKLVGTIGVFISMSGYSDEAVDALRYGKSLNLVLWDERDIRLAATEGFEEVLTFKLRAAAEEGEIFTPYVPKTAPHVRKPVLIVVESPVDEMIVSIFARHLIASGRSIRPTIVVSAYGRKGLAKIAQFYTGSPAEKVLVIADADGNSQQTRDWLQLELPDQDAKFIIVDPGVEGWIELDREKARRSGKSRLEHLIRATNVADLAVRDPSFAEFVQYIES